MLEKLFNQKSSKKPGGFASKKLKLAKTHDFSALENPRLTVVFIHGIASDSGSFKKAIEYLEGTTSLKDIRFVAFDLLGAGESLKSDKLEYNYTEMLEALDNSIAELNLTTPLILVGHSMGCLIASHYADQHKSKVKKLILISPPVYKPEDLENPVFQAGMDNFKKVVIQKNHGMKDNKAFNNEIEKIILNPKNYLIYTRLTKPTIIVYGLADQIIASFNIPGLLKANPKISAIQTPGTHGVSRDKYSKIVGILEETK